MKPDPANDGVLSSSMDSSLAQASPQVCSAPLDFRTKLRFIVYYIVGIIAVAIGSWVGLAPLFADTAFDESMLACGLGLVYFGGCFIWSAFTRHLRGWLVWCSRHPSQ